MKFNLVLITLLASGILSAQELKIGILQEWDILHPISYQTAASESVMHFLQRQIVYRSPDGTVLPEVAVQVPSFKNKKAREISEGGKKIIVADWDLRSEAVWSDGQPITCADWKFAWQVGLNDKVSKTEKGIYTKISDITWAKNNKKCTVKYSDNSWAFDRDLPPFLPSHIESQVYQKWADQQPQAYEQNSNYVKNPSLAGLYSGPYKIQEIKLGQYILFVANEKYWGQKPSIQKILLKYIPDSNLIKSYLSSGQVQAIAPVGLPFDVALNIQSSAMKGVHVQLIPSFLYQALFLNLESPSLKFTEVRQALSLAIDKETLVKSFFNSQLEPAMSIQSVEKNIKNIFKGDIKKANELLDKNGWKLNSGLRQKNGQKLIVVFKTSAGLKVLENIQVYLCDRFSQVGIQCSIKNEPARVFLGDSVPRGQFEIGLFGNATYPDTSLKGLFHSAEIPNTKNAWAGGNVIRLVNSQMDQLLNQYDSEKSCAARKKILNQIDQMVIQNHWIIPLYHRKEAMILPSALKGFQNDFRSTTMVFPEKWVYNP